MRSLRSKPKLISFTSNQQLHILHRIKNLIKNLLITQKKDRSLFFQTSWIVCVVSCLVVSTLFAYETQLSTCMFCHFANVSKEAQFTYGELSCLKLHKKILFWGKLQLNWLLTCGLIDWLSDGLSIAWLNEWLAYYLLAGCSTDCWLAEPLSRLSGWLTYWFWASGLAYSLNDCWVTGWLIDMLTTFRPTDWIIDWELADCWMVSWLARGRWAG